MEKPEKNSQIIFAKLTAPTDNRQPTTAHCPLPTAS